MRIAVFGAGGVGGYFGGRLAEAGQDVSFVARGAHLEAIRRQGLRLKSPKGDATVRPRLATDDPGEIGPVDVVIVATKTFQLDGAAASIPPLLDDDTLVVPLLNGVEAAERLSRALRRGVVYGGLCRIISFVAEPGVVEHVGAEPYVAFGAVGSPGDRRDGAGAGSARSDAERAGAADRAVDRPGRAGAAGPVGSAGARAEEVREAFARAGVQAEVAADIRRAIWRKFLLVASWGAIGAITRLPIGVIRSQPETRDLLTRAMEEIMAVGRAQGAALDDGALTAALDFFGSLPPEATTSMQRDIEAGRRSELEEWSGAVVRLGEGAGIDTPVHRVVHHALVPWERRARGEIQIPDAR